MNDQDIITEWDEEKCKAIESALHFLECPKDFDCTIKIGDEDGPGVTALNELVSQLNKAIGRD